MVLLAGLSEDTEEATTQTEVVANKILVTLNQPYHLASLEHLSTPCIGITLFCGQQRTTEELLKHADLAMYKSKSNGRNSMCCFESEFLAIKTENVSI